MPARLRKRTGIRISLQTETHLGGTTSDTWASRGNELHNKSWTKPQSWLFKVVEDVGNVEHVQDIEGDDVENVQDAEDVESKDINDVGA